MQIDWLESALLEWLIDDDDIAWYAASVIGLSPMTGLLSLVSVYVIIAVDLYGSGIELIGLLYLLVYVGGVAILFAFVLRLLDLSDDDDEDGDDVSFILGAIMDWLPISDSNIEDIEVFNSSTLIIDYEGSVIGKLEFSQCGVLLVWVAIGLLLTIIGTISVIKHKGLNL